MKLEKRQCIYKKNWKCSEQTNKKKNSNVLRWIEREKKVESRKQLKVIVIDGKNVECITKHGNRIVHPFFVLYIVYRKIDFIDRHWPEYTEFVEYFVGTMLLRMEE